MQNTIPPAIMDAAVSLLRPYVQTLTPEGLTKALIATEEKDGTHDKMLSRQEAAKLLSVSVQTIDRDLKAGLLKSTKLGSRIVRIPYGSVRELLGKSR